MAVSRKKESPEVPDGQSRDVRESRGSGLARTDLHLRPMALSDLDEIMAIEKVSFNYPWSARFFLQELGVPCSRSMLAVQERKTLGYVVYWLLASDLDIHNIAVHPASRRQGVGRLLLGALIDEAKSRGLNRVTLEVRKSNAAAQQLYLSSGFVTQGIRKGYYSDDGEDALVMVLDITKDDSRNSPVDQRK